MSNLHALPISGDRIRTGAEIVVRAPYDGAELGRVPEADAATVDAAVKAAHATLAEPTSAWQRAEILDRAAALLAERREAFARSIAGEAGKPIKAARVEATRAVGTFLAAAVAARSLAGDVVPMDANPAGEGKVGFTVRVPIGVVGAISPFNFPLNLVAHKLAPAIAADCPVVLKPATQTPLTALMLADLLLDECGLAPGRLNVVTGGGSTVGGALVDHDDVAYITFTGSPEVGWSIRARAPHKRVGLELGNNAPVIVEPDADLELAAAKIAAGGFGYSGQTCISVQRVYVQDAAADALVDRLVPKVEALGVGDPLDEGTDVSALITEADRDRVTAWVDEAVAEGAVLRTGGEIRDGILRPTVLTDVTPQMKVCTHEVFGPMVGVAPYATLDDALTLANQTRYGLQAAVFTRDLAVAMRCAHELEYGGVIVNDSPSFRTDQMPYGGVKDSGNTREGPAYAVREMTEERMIVLPR